MSGLLERIVRRRRASASSRLGPPSQNVDSPAFGSLYAGNGGPPEAATARVNGALPRDEAVAAVEGGGVAEAPRAPEAIAGSAAPGAGTPAALAAVVPPVEDEATRPQPPAPPAVPSFRERGRMRRRARYLRRLRELQLRDIGGVIVELERFERERPDLVQEKVAAAARTDAELRALEQALGERRALRELREAGIGGTCGSCGEIHGSEDRFCASCGEPLRARKSTAEEPPRPPISGPR
jgi:hypothetical protein